MRRRLRIALCTAAVLPLLVLAVAAPLNALQCRLTGELLTTCCCPAPDSQQPISIGAGDCCERTRIEADRPPSEPPVDGPLVLPVASVRTPVEACPPLLAADRPVPPDGAVPRPPLILVKRAFLI